MRDRRGRARRDRALNARDRAASRLGCGGLLLVRTILLYTGAVVVVGSVYLLAFDQMACHALVAAALAGAIAHALYLTRDRGDASTGGWLVARTPFAHARKDVEHAAMWSTSTRTCRRG